MVETKRKPYPKNEIILVRRDMVFIFAKDEEG